MTWQPIETAPKDGSVMLLAQGEFVALGSNCRRAYLADTLATPAFAADEGYFK